MELRIKIYLVNFLDLGQEYAGLNLDWGRDTSIRDVVNFIEGLFKDDGFFSNWILNFKSSTSTY